MAGLSSALPSAASSLPASAKLSLTPGTPSTVQTVTVPITAGGTLTAVRVVTQGIAGLDFTINRQPGDTCVVNQTYSQTSCTITVQFKPKAPGTHSGAVLLSFSNVNTTTSAVQYLYGYSQGPLGVIIPGLMSTVAGSNNSLYVPGSDGIPATSAPIQLPLGEVIDASGNLYISDWGNNRVRKVTGGIISTYAGGGSIAVITPGLAATSASIGTPSGLAMDGAGNLYFADRTSNLIFMVDPSGTLSIIAGTQGVSGYKDGPVLQAELTSPNGLAIDADQNLYIADTGNNVIRMIDLKVDSANRQINTIAGTLTPGFGGDGQQASHALFNQPWGLAVGPDGLLYIADLNNNVIRRIDPTGSGATVTVIGVPTSQGTFGGDGGPASQANLQTPEAVAVDLAGNIYVADTQNNVIRKATLQPAGGYIISTISGHPSDQKFSGDGANADAATMSSPSSLALDSVGDLYFGDLFHNRVRMISSQLAFQDYGQIKNFQVSPAKTQTFENDGNAGMTVQQITLANASLDGASTCAAGAPLAPAVSCTLNIEFAPQVQNLPDAGAETPGSVTINSDAQNSPGFINLTGDVLTVNPTVTTVVSNGTPSATNADVIFTATVTNGNNGSITGTVTFMDGAATLGTGQMDASGVATFSTTGLAIGSHSITAVYGGDTNNAPSTSTAFTQVVKSGTTLAVLSNQPTATYPQNVTFTATLSGATTPVGGTISFMDGSTLLGTLTPTGAGVASFASAGLTPGQHTITASFSGDANNLTSSGSTTQTINQTPTSTALNVNNLTPTFGTQITLEAAVNSIGTPPALAPLTGKVTFTDTVTRNGSTTSIVLGSISLSNGTANLGVSGLAPGQHSIAAAYSGDTDNASSNSSAQGVNVAQIGTAIAVTSASNQTNAGTPTSFTATITIPGNTVAGGPLSGTVTFLDNGIAIGRPVAITVANNTATAALTTSFNPGSHPITATYSGATNYAGSTSNPFAVSVSKNASTTTVSSTAPNPSVAGQPINLIAVVNGPAGASTPTGTVAFTATPNGGHAINLGQATLTSGTAVLPAINSLASGTYQITATYSGDDDNSSSNGSLTQSVTAAETRLTLVSSTNLTQVGNKVTFTVSLGNINDHPTGTVTFLDNSSAIGQVALAGVSNASVTFTTTTLAVGTHQITANFSGNTYDSPASAGPVAVQIQKLPTNATLASGTNPGILGQPIQLTVTVASENIASTGTVQFMEGTTVIGVSPVISSAGSVTGTASLTISNLSLGSHSIFANYLGDGNHLTSSANTIHQQVLFVPTVVLTTPNPSSIAGRNVTLSANITGTKNASPTGTVTFKDGGVLLGTATVTPAAGASVPTGISTFNISSLAPGTHNITAIYSGDDDYQMASSPALAHTVTIANTSVSLSSSANPATAGSPLTFTTNVIGTGASPSGTVTFMDGGTTLGTVALTGSGAAVLTTSTLLPGQHTIKAIYNGSTDNQSSFAVLQELVKNATVTSIVTNANPTLTLAPIALTASVGNGGTQRASGSITFRDGSSLLGTASLDGNGQAVLSLPSLPAGQHNIVASYGGDAVDFSSSSTALPLSVQLRPTTNVVTATTTSLTDGKQLTLISVVRWSGPTTPTGTVNFKVGSTIVGTRNVDSVGVATLTIVLDPGSAGVVSSYSGDAAYAPSISPTTTVTEGPPTSFTLQLSDSDLKLQSKQNTTISLNIKSLNGFNDTLTFGCIGLPYRASCTFDKSQIDVSANGTQTVKLVVDTSAPLLAGSEVKTSGYAAQSSRLAIPILLCSLLSGLILVRSRGRRPIARLLLLICSVMLASGISGCGALNINGTPPGAYTFKVTASGKKTGITQTALVTLTVQQ
jgi:large repetitive protein